MIDRKERRTLGRGLSALMADVPPVNDDIPAAAAAEARIPVDRIAPNPDQPRRAFPKTSLEELAASIREKGIIQPLILRPRPGGRYQIVAGERRWRAAQMAQLHEVPAVVRELDDEEMLELSIVENIQRSDFNPIEEAAGYKALMTNFGHTQEAVAEALGKSRSHIANMTRLLGLPAEVQAMVIDGRLSAGHARAALASDDPASLAAEVVRKGLTVRQAERLAKKSPDTGGHRPSTTTKDADTRALENDLMAALKMKVSIDHEPGTQKGTVTIRYISLEQLDAFCQKLSSIS